MMHISLAIALTLSLLTSASPVARRPSIGVPLTKRSNLLTRGGAVNIDTLKGHIATTTGKILRGFENYEKNTGQRHPLHSGNNQARAVGELALTDDSNILWQGTISVGTPAVSYIVDFDTGSSDLFLPSSSCGTTCSGHTKYNPSSSSTSKSLGKDFSLSYGDGSTVTGQQFRDTVKIAGLTATSQTLGSATQYSSGFQSANFAPDGLMGMAFQSISEYNAPPVFQSLVSEDQTSSSLFAMKLTSGESELTLGGLNEDLFTGDITYVPVTQDGYWQIDFDALKVNGEAVVGTTTAIVDSGTTLVIGDPESVASFYARIPGAVEATATIGSGFYTFPCDSTIPTTSFTLSGKDFPMTGSLNMGPTSEGSSDCVGSIIGTSLGSEFWILGDAFMTNYYTVFDFGNSQVGFAALA